ncbi:MAG: hypothetical protein LBI43_06795 [Streptococcaceae bacterium]|jgi:hypothetical protein|nr:hypothetical protein [Streptococcaceae bacterium]
MIIENGKCYSNNNESEKLINALYSTQRKNGNNQCFFYALFQGQDKIAKIGHTSYPVDRMQELCAFKITRSTQQFMTNQIFLALWRFNCQESKVKDFEEKEREMLFSSNYRKEGKEFNSIKYQSFFPHKESFELPAYLQDDSEHTAAKKEWHDCPNQTSFQKLIEFIDKGITKEKLREHLID